jgi:hypothetical protein
MKALRNKIEVKTGGSRTVNWSDEKWLSGLYNSQDTLTAPRISVTVLTSIFVYVPVNICARADMKCN